MENSPEVLSRNFAAKETNYAPSFEESHQNTSLNVRIRRKAQLLLFHKERGLVRKGLLRLSEWCINDENMNITKVNGLHFPILFLEMRNDPNHHRTDPAARALVYLLTWK